MIRVGLLGGTGKMGQRVAHLLAGEFAGRAELSASVGRSGSMESLLSTDVVIDFSQPDATLELAQLASKSKKALPAFVVGTTGWKPKDIQVIEALAGKTPVLLSSNFSMGVLALQQILEDAAPMLRKLGYAPVIVETHHEHKKDSPSGTALMLAKTIEAITGEKTQMHSVRAGEVIGDHEIGFYGAADRIVLAHYAQDRSIFARGAIDTALWLAGKRDKTGNTVLTMKDFLAEKVLQ